jgi:hypothetical protein
VVTEVIDIENLTKKFGSLTPVDNLKLHIDEGEVLVFLGQTAQGVFQQVGALILIPFGAIYVMFEVNLISFNITTLLIICAVILLTDVILFYLTKTSFPREEILTKWK